MTKLFDPERGLGLAFLRQPVGLSDFSREYSSYDDVPGDVNLEHFSVARDDEMIIPLIKQAMSINRNIKVIAAAWTAPKWMKTYDYWNTVDSNGNGIYNRLNAEHYGTYANYLVKFIEEYEKRGINIYAISPQNEPDGRHAIPSMFFDKYDMSRFVGGYLKPTLVASGLETKLIGYDFNWFGIDSDEENNIANLDRIRGFITGTQADIIAFHTYAGDVKVQSTIHSDFPDTPIYITEAAGNTGADNFMLSVTNTVKAFKNHASAYIYWNIMLDEERGPLFGGTEMNPVGIGLMEYNKNTGKVKYLSDYYAIAHYSRFISCGAHIIETNDTGAQLFNIAAVNPDGSMAAIIANIANVTQAVKIVIDGGYVIKCTVPKNSAVTVKWNPDAIRKLAI